MNLHLIRCFITALALAGSLACGQDTATPKAGGLSKLSKENLEKLSDLAAEAQKLNAKKRYFEALQKVNDMEAIAPDLGVVWNLRGSIYVSYRDFAKARESFTKALELQPKTFEPSFNLSELLYVEQKYPEAEEAFATLLKDFPKSKENVRHLILFKILVCRLKQDKVPEAAEVLKGFTAMDDTPAYYFSKAAFAFHDHNPEEGNSWVRKAQKIYSQTQTSVFEDTLLEARWL